MPATLLDTTTGQRRAIEGHWCNFSVAWWLRGNGSCDCDRAIAFGHRSPGGGRCRGAERYLIVATDDPEFTLEELNADYSAELRKSWLPQEAAS